MFKNIKDNMLLKLILFLLIISCSIFCSADNFEFKPFSLNLNPYGGGSFSIRIANETILEGVLFFSVKSEPQKHIQFFQNSNFVKGKIKPVVSLDGTTRVINVSGEMVKEELGIIVPFTETIRISPDGELKFDYYCTVPASLAFKEAPELLVSIPISVVGGKGLWQETKTGEAWKVFDEEFKEGKILRGNQVIRMKIATDSGPIDFIPLVGEIRYFDTRFYKKTGGLRIDILGIRENDKWHISFTVKLSEK